MEVRVEGLRFARRNGFVLDVPALTLAAGRVTALLGPNGSGKSTLLRLIAALERPARGHITLDGHPAAPDRPTRAAVAFAFQEPVFVAGSLRKNLALALRLRGAATRQGWASMEAAIDACGIGHLLDRDARQLSGGEAQRANLARALGLRAPVTLLDEPLAGLDPPARASLLHDLPDLLRSFATTTILVTHDRDEALRLGDDLVVMLDGRVRATGPKREVFLAPPDAATATFLGHTVLDHQGRRVAVRPGALVPGPGEVTFTLEVEELFDLATHREIVGTIGGTRVALLVHGEGARPGERMTVSAPAAAVREITQ
ncbi:MAG: hypothetical protein Kow0010_26870 [Dehalococcoidia bacterium]